MEARLAIALDRRPKNKVAIGKPTATHPTPQQGEIAA